MSNTLLIVLISVAAAIVSFVIAWIILRKIGDKKISGAEETARRTILEAEKEAEIKKC